MLAIQPANSSRTINKPFGAARASSSATFSTVTSCCRSRGICGSGGDVISTGAGVMTAPGVVGSHRSRRHLCLAALLRATSVRHAESRSGKSASMRRSISGNTSRISASEPGLLPVPGSPTTPSQRWGGSTHPGVACAQRACPINADAAASNGAAT